MDDNNRSEESQQTIIRLLSLGLRLGLIAILLKPAMSKALTYERSVSLFDALGIPLPGLMVVIAGSIQVLAIVLFLIGRLEPLAAGALVPVMIVAMLFAGLDWKNATVLIGSLVIIILEIKISRTQNNFTHI
ncbi:DoxX family protein [Halocatena halophila]|uniref:DoxX family protein n=1 Tax=Halocatena halophila TaxID=2814576 RepID=UPI002ED07729